METVVDLSLQELKDYIINKVEEKRGTELWSQVQQKLNPYINVDLEA